MRQFSSENFFNSKKLDKLFFFFFFFLHSAHGIYYPDFFVKTCVIRSSCTDKAVIAMKYRAGVPEADDGQPGIAARRLSHGKCGQPDAVTAFQDVEEVSV